MPLTGALSPADDRSSRLVRRGAPWVHHVVMRCLSVTRSASLCAVAWLLALTACGTQPAQQPGTWDPQYYGFGLSHAGFARATAIWHTELKRQHVQHLDAVVYFRVGVKQREQLASSSTCPAGPLLRVVIRGIFPTKPGSVRYEDLYATPQGRVCDVAYRRTMPDVPNRAAEHLRRSYDVKNSG